MGYANKVSLHAGAVRIITLLPSADAREYTMWMDQVKTYGRLIKFSHTVFALPFALAAVLLANRQDPVSWFTLWWIVVAMAAARSAAMGFNRLADYEYDRLNPRTSNRPLTAGQIPVKSVLVFVVVSSLVFVVSATMLGRTCLLLSIPVLAVLLLYSYTKRFTTLSHLFLGFAIGLAPAGAWVAASGTLDYRILLLSGALMTYIAGFDILYACQDVDFDRQAGLYSLPARRGIRKALAISTILHLMTFLLLFSIYFVFNLGPIYLGFLVLITLLLVIEHKLVKPGDLDHVNFAFFHINSVISVLLFLGIWTDISFF